MVLERIVMCIIGFTDGCLMFLFSIKMVIMLL